MKLFWCTIEWFGSRETRFCIANDENEAIRLVIAKVKDETGVDDDEFRVYTSEVTKVIDWRDNSAYKIVFEKID
jgi:hypothetical protein